MAGHVRESVQQIDEDSWLVGDKFILRRQSSASAECVWKDSDGFCYIVSDVVAPLPTAAPLPADSHVRLVCDAGDASAVWSFGEAFLKVKITPPGLKNATKEHTVLEWLAQQRLSFAVPKVLHHVDAGDRSYLLVTRVPGQLLADAWRTMDDEEKRHYVGRVIEICEELSSWTSQAITGIDGREFPDIWLDPFQIPQSFTPQSLTDSCTGLGMDCSVFYFWHSDLGPHNIIINSGREGALGIIDWEIAGFVPQAWIRTKFGVSWALDFTWPGVHGDDPSLREWREQVERAFGERGYPEVKAAWKRLFSERFSLMQRT